MKIWTQLKKVHNAITYKVYTPLNKIKFLLNGVVYGKNLCVRGNIYIFKHYESGKIIIGDNVIINSASWANPIGCGDRTYFQINEKAVLTIGNNCGISNTAITCEEKVTIEDNVIYMIQIFIRWNIVKGSKNIIKVARLKESRFASVKERLSGLDATSLKVSQLENMQL